MNTLYYPNDSIITIVFSSGCNPVTGYFGAISGTISGSGIYNSSLSAGQGQLTTRLNITSGTAPYTGEILLSNLNIFNGATQKFILTMPNSINPTIQFVDSLTSGILVTQPGLATGTNVFVEFEYNNSWLLNQWA